MDVAGESGVEVTVGPSEGLPPWTFATSEQRILAAVIDAQERLDLVEVDRRIGHRRDLCRHHRCSTRTVSWRSSERASDRVTKLLIR